MKPSAAVGHSSSPIFTPHQQKQQQQHFRFRRCFCLFLCCLLSILQVFFLYRHLYPFGSDDQQGATSTFQPKAPEGLVPESLIPSSKRSFHLNRTFPPPAFRLSASPQRRLPDCLIIGVRKGGTRALLDALAMHPRVRVARHEVHFFDQPNFYRLGPEWYRAQMPEATTEQAIIEKTPAYLTNAAVPQRVHALKPSIKLILIVREPVARTISDFTQIRQTKLDRHKAAIDFEQMSFTAFPNGTMSLNVRFKPIRNSLYAQHFGRWLEYFPTEQFLVLDGDKFIRNPLSQLQRVEQFLGIGSGLRADQLVYNPDKGFYCFRRDPATPLHCLGQSKGRRRQVTVSAKFRQQLAASFGPHNERFFRLLNRVFPGWNY